MPGRTPLQEIFSSCPDFAWELLAAECEIQLATEITIAHITKLSELYMKAVEQLNCAQDSREKYFSTKMAKLMSEPYVIRCFNNESTGHQSQLEHKRRALEQKLSLKTEKHNNEVLQTMLANHEEKAKKMKEKVEKELLKSEKHLEWRLMKRFQVKEEKLKKKGKAEEKSLSETFGTPSWKKCAEEEGQFGSEEYEPDKGSSQQSDTEVPEV